MAARRVRPVRQQAAVVCRSHTPAIQRCLASSRPDAIIRAQAAEAARAGIVATPTLRVLERQSGRAVVLAGPAEADALLSTLDWLADPAAAASSARPRLPLP